MGMAWASTSVCQEPITHSELLEKEKDLSIEGRRNE
jgi:hypothetical protein